MSYNDSNAYGTDGRRNEFDTTRRNEFGDNTRQGEFNDNTRRGGFNDNTTHGYDSTIRSDDYTSGNAGTIGSGPTGFTDSTRAGGRTGDTYGNTADNYGSSTIGGSHGPSTTDKYGSSKSDNYGTTDAYGSSGAGHNYGSSGNTREDDLNTRTGGYGSSNTDNYGTTNRAGGYSQEKYGSSAGGATSTGYGSSGTGDRVNTGKYGNPNTDNFGHTDRDTYGRGTNATGADDFNTGRGNDHKPTLGEKAKGTMETIQGKITKNPELVERGQERKAGNLDHH